jgi:hypothetical protein
MKYRKKPVEVHAHLWTGESDAQLPPWLQSRIALGHVELLATGSSLPVYAAIKTLEGTMTASPGDWIIKGTKGELYPCKPDVFAEVYEPVIEEEKVHG